MLRSRITRVATLLLAAAAAAACDGGGTAPGAPRVSIRLTDAPADLSEAWVEIEQIYLQGSGGRVDLRTTSTGLVNLLTLRNDVASLVEDAPVPAGSYSELRFVIGDAYIRTKSGQVFATPGAALPPGVTPTGTLKCPSCAQSGLKVKLPGGSIDLAEETRIMLVDFDASESFGHEAGNSGQWVMHPVLHATDFVTAGAISGTVALAQGVVLPATCGGGAVKLSQFQPKAILGSDTVATGAVDSTGAYRIGYLAPGTYTLGQAPALAFANGDSLIFASAATPPSVTVTSGTTAHADYAITSAACQ
jgi:hypothetical protein